MTSDSDSLLELAATSAETLAALLDASKRVTRTIPLERSFVTLNGEPGPLARFVRGRKHHALDQYLLLRALTTKPMEHRKNPWSVTREAEVWARALGYTERADARGRRIALGSALHAVSRNWRYLDEDVHLVTRDKDHDSKLCVGLLASDGSGKRYRPPQRAKPARKTGPRGRGYFRIPFAYFDHEWHRRLHAPGKAVLLIALCNGRPGGTFSFPQVMVPKWYGISEDTFARGVAELQEHGLMRTWMTSKKAPLAPKGVTWENHYTLLDAFDYDAIAAADASPADVSEERA